MSSLGLRNYYYYYYYYYYYQPVRMSCMLLMTTPSSERSSRRLSGATGALYNLAGNSRNESASLGNRCKTPRRRFNDNT